MPFTAVFVKIRFCRKDTLAPTTSSHQLKFSGHSHYTRLGPTHFFGGGGGGFFLGGEGGGGGFFFAGDDDGNGLRGGGDDDAAPSPSSVALTAASHESSVLSNRVSFSLTRASL